MNFLIHFHNILKNKKKIAKGGGGRMVEGHFWKQLLIFWVRVGIEIVRVVKKAPIVMTHLAH